MARDKSDASTNKKKKKTSDDNPVSEVVALVKTYARQEAIDPLRNAGKWLAFGAAGAFALAVGFALVLLALLRLLQTETGRTFDGNWSFVPYLITLAAALLVILVAVTRIRKPTLEKGGSGR